MMPRADPAPVDTVSGVMHHRPVPLGRGRSAQGAAPLIVGILNLTPDSFSDGGALDSVAAVLDAARRLRDAGARILEVGGESTRPGAAPVGESEELERVLPALRALAEADLGLPLAVDTTKSGVFRAAWDAGASILNDVSALRSDPEMAAAAAATDAAVILMHRRGDPETMDGLAAYDDPVLEVIAELREQVTAAEAAGIPRERLVVDPGLGFAKSAAHSWEIVRRIDEFSALELPLMVGPSRKRFLGAATGRSDPGERDVATAVVVAHLARAGVELVRVHAVAAARDALAIVAALYGGEEPER